MSLDKQDEMEGRGASPARRLQQSETSLIAATPFVIICLIILALMWGVGVRIIIEAWKWGFDLFGF